MSKYIGVVKDRLQTMETRKTNSYDTHKEAHDAAESLCDATMGDRGTIDVVQRYYIDYGTGAGNEWVEGTLEDAQKTAAESVAYTQTDAVILEDGEEVARLAWCGCRPDDDDIEVVADFGDFGYYYWA